jgi:alpha-galactosidase
MDSYGFDNFILDFGWAQSVGNWQADTEKFPQTQFEELLAIEQEKGANVGLWTCPHLLAKDSPQDNLAIASIDNSNIFNRRVDGYLIDLAGSDFTGLLRNHVTDLRLRYQMNWWKYDQFIFFEDTESGLMKNVVAFQDALRAVRRENPDLAIENCMNGGRMINELTALTSQAIWLRDSSDTGLEHAKLNIETTLGVVEFLFPWLAYHFTNNFDQMNSNDDELTKYYCRSAMAGTWGISSDLSAIPDRQRRIILKEIKYYKQLNPLKLNYLYDIEQPAENKSAAGITFYDWKQQRAGLLLYRWNKTGAFTHHLNLRLIKPDKLYKICDVDARTETLVSGGDLLNKGFDVEFAADRLSALIFIEPVSQPVEERLN